MKLEKSLLIMIAAAVTLSVAAPSCSKEKIEKKDAEKKAEQEKEKAPLYGCPACGMG